MEEIDHQDCVTVLFIIDHKRQLVKQKRGVNLGSAAAKLFVHFDLKITDFPLASSVNVVSPM